MRLRTLLWSSCIPVAIAICAIPAVAVSSRQCVPGKVTAASYTWDFKGEANALFTSVESDARQASYHADKLQSFDRDAGLSWQAHADQLNGLRADIDDIGNKLCRLEAIRRAVAPWQQREIDRIAVSARLMADNAQDAIEFVNANQGALWRDTYRHYVDNLYNQAKDLTRSVGNAAEFASVSKEYQELRHNLGTRGSS